jgi:hypothetical protein
MKRQLIEQHFAGAQGDVEGRRSKVESGDELSTFDLRPSTFDASLRRTNVDQDQRF